MKDLTNTAYASFGQRFAAMLIDNFIFAFLLAPLVMLFFDQPNYSEAEMKQIIETQGIMGLIDKTQLLFQQFIILCITVFFWVRFTGTPGKRLMKISVVDATTHQSLNVMQSIMRYFGYFVSAMPMGVGFLWMLMDDKNQGWHDKLSNTVVIKSQGVNIVRTQSRQGDSPLEKSKQSNGDDDVFTA